MQTENKAQSVGECGGRVRGPRLQIEASVSNGYYRTSHTDNQRDRSCVGQLCVLGMAPRGASLALLRAASRFQACRGAHASSELLPGALVSSTQPPTQLPSVHSIGPCDHVALVAERALKSQQAGGSVWSSGVPYKSVLAPTGNSCEHSNRQNPFFENLRPSASSLKCHLSNVPNLVSWDSVWQPWH
jgi:hypothetical protein